jgi:SAM-dependent methyltransferase
VNNGKERIVRPRLDKTISIQDFRAHYWLKDELAAFCRTCGLPHTGSKTDLEVYIEYFLTTGKVPNPMRKSRPRRVVSIPLALDELIRLGDYSDEEHRAFFKSVIGESFKLTVGFMQFCIDNAGAKTYADAVAWWKQEQQLEYNRFVRAYFKANPGSGLQEATAAWKRSQEQPGDYQRNQTNPYDVDPHIAEIYDQQENYTDDVDLIRWLIGDRDPLRILEPFCGTGRILLPLAQDGHTLVGMDQARTMLDRIWLKATVDMRFTLFTKDAVTALWPANFDLVILGANCFYELATPQEQEHCIQNAAEALKPDGYIYIDNNHMEGELDPAWQTIGMEWQSLSGVCTDGTRVVNTVETIWTDVPQRLARFRRRALITAPDGSTTTHEYIQQKHPVSAAEVYSWLEHYGFEIERMFGDRAASPYSDDSERAIFWARKR